MALIVLCSVTGSPGTTTAALGLALHWPRDVLLVDADPVPHQGIEAGHLAGASTQGRGLLAVAQAHRERHDVQRALWELSLPLTTDTGPTRRFVAGFTHPGGGELFQPVWGEFASALRGLESVGVDVVLDAGRIGRGLPAPLLRQADAVVVVTRSSLRALAALRLTLPTLVDAAATDAPQAELGLLVVAPGQPYSPAEIAEHFGVAAIGSLPWKPESAEVWSDGAKPPKRHASSDLVRATTALAERLAHRVGHRARLREAVA